MDLKSITSLLDERIQLADSIRQMQDRLASEVDRLQKMDTAIGALKDLFPQYFNEAAGAAPKQDESQFRAVDPVWDYRLPFRRRVKELLRSMGRFTKASELAKIVYEKESFLNPDTTELYWQHKISAALTSLKLQQKEGIATRQIHPGSSGWAWGFREWKTEKELAEMDEYMRQLDADEDYQKARELFDQQS